MIECLIYLSHPYGSGCSIPKWIKYAELKFGFSLFGFTQIEYVVYILEDFFEILPQMVLILQLLAQQSVQFEISARWI